MELKGFAANVLLADTTGRLQRGLTGSGPLAAHKALTASFNHEAKFNFNVHIILQGNRRKSTARVAVDMTALHFMLFLHRYSLIVLFLAITVTLLRSFCLN